MSVCIFWVPWETIRNFSCEQFDPRKKLSHHNSYVKTQKEFLGIKNPLSRNKQPLW